MLSTKPWPIKTPIVTASRCQGAKKYWRRCEKSLQGALVGCIAEGPIELVNGFAGGFTPCRDKAVSPFFKNAFAHLYSQFDTPSVFTCEKRPRC